VPDNSPAARTFDALGIDYERAYNGIPELLEAIDWISVRLPDGARILDIGSGTGRPTAEVLAKRGFAVTGLDVSEKMVELARRQVPGASFELADVRAYETPAGSWDAVCVFFPLLQMSRDDIDTTLRNVATWLRPGGYLVLATVPADVEGLEFEWMGQPVVATSYSTEAYTERLRATGLELLHVQVSTFQPDHAGTGPEEQLFIHAQKPE
jgi:SAM-dependent methyltransferase